MHKYTAMGTRLMTLSINDHVDNEIFHWLLETIVVTTFKNGIHTGSFFKSSPFSLLKTAAICFQQ